MSRPIRRRRAGALPALLAAVTAASLLAGCTAVPSNSTPQVVNKVGAPAATDDLSLTPPPGADPRTIVSDFLRAAATNDPHHTAARGFLTTDASNRWSDTTVNIVDEFTIGNFTTATSQSGSIDVSGRPIGAISASGTYRPDLTGDGTGGPNAIRSQYGLQQVKGEWRIASLLPGVPLNLFDFKRLYTQRELYFYDLAEQHLVPDPRFTAITDTGALAGWLVTQLVSGPRPELQNAVTTEFPQLDPSRVTVAVGAGGAPSVISIPGAGQLNAATRSRIAAQLAATLVQVPEVDELSIADTGKPVTIPAAHGALFSASLYPSPAGPVTSAPSLYYLRGGGVVDEAGRSLPGPVGTGTYGLSSAAVASGGSPDLRVAGISGIGSAAGLLIGTVRTGLRRTALSGKLSRPAWAPGLDEVWLGDGKTIYRCGADAKPVKVEPTVTTGQLNGSITALRLSPEGSRVAMVVTATDGTNVSQVWVGSIVRSAAQVRIDGLEPVTPVGVSIKDVAWNDPLKLFVIGSVNGDTNIFEVQVDGSLWTPRDVLNLPQAPDTITVAANQPAWVSAGTTVWVRRAGEWASPGPGTTNGTNGTDPVYLE
ncbi:MAG TPA: LpqB family beta-propeller domain-containing protein [Jatrophihabitantaceae bacterium]|jgi:hypothetical protein|nr:LpqB family beta-propeller domain-containing protein [Jatrophihabitantaceae bacterium]